VFLAQKHGIKQKQQKAKTKPTFLWFLVLFLFQFGHKTKKYKKSEEKPLTNRGVYVIVYSG